MLLLSALLPLFASSALASTDEAWETFRTQVHEACLALAGPGSEVEVSPFGSESYGAALVVTKTAQGEERAICIFPKATGAAELTTPLPPEN